MAVEPDPEPPVPNDVDDLLVRAQMETAQAEKKLDTAAKRIDAVSDQASTAYLTLLGALAFVAVTLLSLKDADILLNSGMIKLPIVGVEIPTLLFLALTPVVLLALYFNLHLYLTKLWDAFSDAPPDNGGMLADRVKASLVNDLALWMKTGNAPRDEDRIGFRIFLIVLSVWLATPFVLGWIWYKALIATPLWAMGHTASPAAALLVAGLIGIWSWRLARKMLLDRNKLSSDIGRRGRQIEQRRERKVWALGTISWAVTILGFASMGATIAASLNRGGHYSAPDPYFAWLAHPADLSGSDVSKSPVERSFAAFAANWCKIRDLGGGVCGVMPGTLPEVNRLVLARRAFCADHGDRLRSSRTERCSIFFKDVDQILISDYRAARSASGAHEVDLRERYLVKFSAAGAHMDDTTFWGANLSCATLTGGQFTGGVFSKADLSCGSGGVEAFYADFDWTDFTMANLTNANLSGSQFRGAILKGAILNSAKLTAADLSGADLSGADLRNADLRSAVLFGARLNYALIEGANFEGALGLDQNAIALAIGDQSTSFNVSRHISVAPAANDALPLSAATCWPRRPDPLRQGSPLTALMGNPWTGEIETELRNSLCPEMGQRAQELKTAGIDSR